MIRPPESAVNLGVRRPGVALLYRTFPLDTVLKQYLLAARVFTWNLIFESEDLERVRPEKRRRAGALQGEP